MKKKLVAACLFFMSLSIYAQDAPDFTITASDGSVHHLYQDYLDQGRVVMLELMFVTCPPCNAIAEQVEEKYQAWGGGSENVQFISLSIKPNDNNVNIASYENNHGLTFPGAGADGGAQQAIAPYKDGTFGPFWGTPTFIVISPDRSVDYGVDFEDLDASIADALAGGSYDITLSGLVRSIDNEVFMSGTIVSAPAYGVQDTVDSFGFYVLQISGTGPRPDSIEVVLSHTPMPPAAGVSTADLISIQKHIINSQSFTHPLQYLAADVNGNHSISAGDLVEIRRLILAKIQDFSPNVPRFFYLVQDYVLASLDDASSLLTPVNKAWIQIGSNNQGNQNFNGIKLGDLK